MRETEAVAASNQSSCETLGISLTKLFKAKRRVIDRINTFWKEPAYAKWFDANHSEASALLKGLGESTKKCASNKHFMSAMSLLSD